MKSIFIHPHQELKTLARLIETSAASWRGVAYYCLKPAQGRNNIDLEALPEKSLCFEGVGGSLIYLGKPIADPVSLSVDVCAMVPDIAANPRLALALLQEETGEPQTLDEIPPSQKGRTKPLSVLLADDDPMTRKLAEGFLAKHVKTLTVENPRKASANFAVLHPDVMFLDIHYQDELHDGFDVLRNILSTDRNAYVVIVSGDGNASTIYKSLKEGARGFIAKPLKAEDFHWHLDKAAMDVSRAA